MNHEGTDTKRLGWIEQGNRIYEILGNALSICNDVVGVHLSDTKEGPKKEPSNSAERLNDVLGRLQERSAVILSQLEVIDGKF